MQKFFEKIRTLDWDGHLLISVKGKSPMLDSLFPFLREQYFWMPVYLFGAAFLYFNYRHRFYQIVLPLLASLAFADMLNARILKPLFARLRPCQMGSFLETLVPCGSGYSFPSNHATNHFALSFFFIFLLPPSCRWLSILLFFWAFLVAYGQVYVNLHFPLDVIAGALIGIAIGWAGAKLCRYYVQKKFPGESVFS